MDSGGGWIRSPQNHCATTPPSRQIVNSAKDIVTAAQLQEATAGYSFVSCANENEPPYQVALYMSFRLPHDDWVRYLRDVAAGMLDRGWTQVAI